MELVKSSVQTVMSLQEEKLSAVLDRLAQIGVENVEDLANVIESDLTSGNLLPPIPARKLIKAWSNHNSPSSLSSSAARNISTPPTPSSSMSDAASTPTTCQTLSADRNYWVHNFDIIAATRQAKSQSQYPTLKQAVETLFSGSQLSVAKRNEFVRFVGDCIFKVCQTPTRASINEVAKKLTEQFTQLKDEIEGTVIGPGFLSLRNQIENRLTYLRRPLSVQKTSVPIRRRLVDNSETVAQKKQIRDGYGCINFLPVSLPENETEETLLKKQASLKEWSASNQWADSAVTHHMSATYSLQRQDLVGQNPLPVSIIITEWPFLLELKYMNQHLLHLLGIDVIEKMEASLDSKKDSLCSFLQSHLQSIKRLKNRWTGMNLTTEPSIGVISLLMAYFGENEEGIFRGFEVIADYYSFAA